MPRHATGDQLGGPRMNPPSQTQARRLKRNQSTSRRENPLFDFSFFLFSFFPHLGENLIVAAVRVPFSLNQRAVLSPSPKPSSLRSDHLPHRTRPARERARAARRAAPTGCNSARRRKDLRWQGAWRPSLPPRAPVRHGARPGPHRHLKPGGRPGSAPPPQARAAPSCARS